MYSYCGNNPINRLDPGGDRFLYIDFGDNIPTPSIGVGGGAGGIAAAVLVVNGCGDSRFNSTRGG